MRVLIVHAHPEPRSFTAAMKDVTAGRLAAAGHEVLVSDLYAMGFDPVAKAADFGTRQDPTYLVYAKEQRHGHATGTLAPDVAAEVTKLLAADLLILIFPVFWFSVPAMMKGWLDRVLIAGPVYGGRRLYAAGGLAGRRAWPIMTMGSRAHMFGQDAVHGELEPMLRHLTRGTLHYAGYAVIEPFVAWHVPYIDAASRRAILADLATRLDRLATLPATPPPALSGFDAQMRPLGASGARATADGGAGAPPREGA